MLLSFIRNQWKETFRSSIWQKNLAVNIILGFFIVYFLLSFAFLGFVMKEIIGEIFPDDPLVARFNGFVLYYVIFDVFSRFYLQEVPVLSIQPYLHLPIRKGKLVHYLLSKSALSVFNFFPFLFFVPFGIRVIALEYSALATVGWFASLTALIFFNNFVVVYLKKQMVQNFKLFAAIGILYVAVALLDYLGVFSFQTVSTAVFAFILEMPLAALSIIALPFAMYLLNYQFLKNNTYLEELSTKKQRSGIAFGNTEFLDRFGDIGKYISLELKLIWRNKRTRSVAQISAVFLFYGLIFYTQDIYLDGYYMLIFVGIFITGMFMMNYGQFILGWESSYFDGIISKNIDPYRYYLAKFWLFIPVCTAFYAISLLYGFFGIKVILMHTMCFLYNIGINVFVILYFSTYNRKKIDLQAKAAFNWQGTGASQFILMIPSFGIPMLLFLPFWWFEMYNLGILVISGLSIISLAFSKVWLTLIAKRFTAEKYRIAAGFRHDG